MKEYESVIQGMNAKVTKKTISLPEDLLARGIERATEDGRSFSSYVQKLIRLDAEGKLPTEQQKTDAKAAA